jgi:hypothetical protein
MQQHQPNYCIIIIPAHITIPKTMPYAERLVADDVEACHTAFSEHCLGAGPKERSGASLGERIRLVKLALQMASGIS